MTSHPAQTTLIRFVDGDLPETEYASLRAHLPSCGACAAEVEGLRALTAGLATPPVAIDADAEAAAVLRRIRAATATAPPARGRTWWWGASGVLAAAAALLLYVRTSDDPGTLSARGGSTGASELARKVGVELEVAVERSAVRISGTYRNLLDRPAYVLVFAIDDKDEVHWAYPAYTDDKVDPAAVALAAKTTHAAFADGAVLDGLGAGTLRVVTLLSPAPLHVSDIEHLDAKARTPDALRARFRAADLREKNVVLR